MMRGDDRRPVSAKVLVAWLGIAVAGLGFVVAVSGPATGVGRGLVVLGGVLVTGGLVAGLVHGWRRHSPGDSGLVRRLRTMADQPEGIRQSSSPTRRTGTLGESRRSRTD